MTKTVPFFGANLLSVSTIGFISKRSFLESGCLKSHRIMCIRYGYTVKSCCDKI